MKDSEKERNITKVDPWGIHSDVQHKIEQDQRDQWSSEEGKIIVRVRGNKDRDMQQLQQK